MLQKVVFVHELVWNWVGLFEKKKRKREVRKRTENIEKQRSKENLRKYICKLTFWLQRLIPKTFTLNLPPLLKNSDINEIKGVLVLKDIISETTCVCVLCTKFQVSSIILTCFRRGNLTPHPHSSPPQKKPLKSPSKIYFFIYSFFNVDNYRTNTVYSKK